MEDEHKPVLVSAHPPLEIRKITAHRNWNYSARETYTYKEKNERGYFHVRGFAVRGKSPFLK